MKALSKLYTANCDSEVVIFATNLNEFVRLLNKLEPTSRNYLYYVREFKKNSIVLFENKEGKTYKLQEVFNTTGVNTSSPTC